MSDESRVAVLDLDPRVAAEIQGIRDDLADAEKRARYLEILLTAAQEGNG